MKFFIHMVLFLVSFVFMALEIINARMIAPAFGDTIYTWSIIISIFLIGSSIGYVIGGKTSDTNNNKKWIPIYLIVSIVFVSFIPLLNDWVYPIVKNVQNVHIATFILSTILFMVPNITLSALVPSVMKIGYEASVTGKKIGSYHTSSAIGSVAGTLITTFYLLPFIGISLSLSILVFLLTTTLVIVVGLENKKYALYFLILYSFCFFPFATAELAIQGEEIIHKTSSSYHTIYVTEIENEKTRLRLLRFGLNDGAIQGTIDVNERGSVQLDYVKNLLHIIHYQLPEVASKNVYMIGHGIGTITGELEKEKAILDVAEIDEKVYQVSQDYFYYKGNSVKIGDGRYLLEKSNRLYDFLVLDAFDGKKVPLHLVTKEFFDLTYKKTNENGFLVMNYIGKIEGDKRLTSIYTTLKTVYPRVTLYARKDVRKDVSQNIYIIASKANIKEMHLNNLKKVTIHEKGTVLMDEKH